MACTPQSLSDNSRCLALAMSTHQLYAAWAYLVCTGGGPIPPGQQGLATDPDGLIITTDDGKIITTD